MTQKETAVSVAVKSAILGIALVPVPDTENKAMYKDGAETAQKMLGLFGQAAVKAVELYAHVAEYPTKEQALAFVEGYKAQAKAASDASKTDWDKDLSRRVSDLSSRMNNVIRATFGYESKDKKGKKIQKPGMGRAKVLAILTGTGTVKEKLSKFSSGELGGRSKSTADGDKGITPVQKRLNGAKEAVPSRESLASLLGATGQAVSKPKQVENVLKEAIRLCPEPDVMDMARACVNRMIQSKDESVRDLGITFRDVLQKEGQMPTPKSKRTIVKKEAATQ
jgi:hypothetical protein